MIDWQTAHHEEMTLSKYAGTFSNHLQCIAAGHHGARDGYDSGVSILESICFLSDEKRGTHTYDSGMHEQQ